MPQSINQATIEGGYISEETVVEQGNKLATVKSFKADVWWGWLFDRANDEGLMPKTSALKLLMVAN